MRVSGRRLSLHMTLDSSSTQQNRRWTCSRLVFTGSIRWLMECDWSTLFIILKLVRCFSTQALDSFGSHHLLDNYLENYPKSKTGEIRNLVFMSAIKVGKWDLAIEERYILDKESFDENLSFKFIFEMYVHIISSFMNLYLCICSPSGSECRFSEAMYRSLNSLKDSQFSLVSSSLDIAR